MEQSLKDLNKVLDFLFLFHIQNGESSPVEPSLTLPVGLRELYRKHSKWTNESNFHGIFWGRSLSVSDGKIYGIECPKGWVGFSQERDGVWLAACPQIDADDTEVAICTNSTAGVVKLPSLNRFLVWLLLQESSWMSEVGNSCDRGIDDDDYWASQGFSELIDCSFDSEYCIQLSTRFRLSGDGKTIAAGNTDESFLFLRGIAGC